MLKKILIFLIVISGVGTIFLGYSIYKEYGKYLNKTENFYKITEKEYEAKTTEAAKKLDDNLIKYFSKKTFILNDGGIDLSKYIKNDTIRLLDFSPTLISGEEKKDLEDLDKLLGFEKSTKKRKKKEEVKEMSEEEIEKILKSFLNREDTKYYTYLEEKFIDFFTDEYNGDYFLNQKEAEDIKKTNLDYINKVKNNLCENITKSQEDIKDGFIGKYLQDLSIKQKIINQNICNTNIYNVRIINNFTKKEILKANILFFLANNKIFAFPGDNWTFNYGQYRNKYPKFWKDIKKKKDKKEIISSCFKSSIKEDIITPKVYDDKKENFGNVKILQTYAKNKTKLFVCILTFQNKETLKYKKEIATILKTNFNDNRKENKNYKKEINDLKKDMGNIMIKKLIENFEKQK